MNDNKTFAARRINREKSAITPTRRAELGQRSDLLRARAMVCRYCSLVSYG